MSQKIKAIRFRHTLDWSEGLFRLEKRTVTRSDLYKMKYRIVCDYWAEFQWRGSNPEFWELVSFRQLENKKGSFMVLRIEEMNLCGSSKEEM